MTELSKGAEVIACPGGRWARCTIKRCNEDGTFNLMPVSADSFLDLWEGVTRAEIAVDDAAAWPGVFASMRGTSGGVSRDDAARAITSLGFTMDDAQMTQWWDETTTTLFGAPTPTLDEAQAYRWFVDNGFSATAFVRGKSDPSRELLKLYWNSLRMGGRDPEDVGRAITLEDTLAVLHLSDDDADARAALDAFEQTHGLTLPATLRALWSKADAQDAICQRHPNNPEPQPTDSWELRRGTPAGPLAVRVMLPHQGDHAWWVGFESGAPDGSVWLSFAPDGDPVRRVATSVAFFFWDLAETGRWWDIADGEDSDDDD